MAITKVRKANRIIRVTENELAKYLANGYTICGEKQSPKKVVADPTPIVEEDIKEEIVEETISPKRVSNKRKK